VRIACVIFEFNGRQYEYDGGLPTEVADAAVHLFDEEGFWLSGYPSELCRQGKEALDTLPTALWEIQHVGGRVLEIRGARSSGAVLHEDWKNPRIY